MTLTKESFKKKKTGLPAQGTHDNDFYSSNITLGGTGDGL